MATATLEPPASSTPAPAPSTPEPQPAPSQEPKAVPAGAPPAPGPVDQSGHDVYAELDAKIRAFDQKPKSTEGKQAPKKDDAKSATPAAAQPAKPVVPVKEPKELRAELDRIRSELKAKSDSHSALEAKIAEYERKGKETEPLVSRLQTLEKEMDGLRAENRALKQETSPEFKQKYDAPFDRLAQRAKGVIEKIQIQNEETGTVRNATWGEFSKIYRLDEFTALRESKKEFGDDGAQIVMGYYRQLHELEDARDLALTEEKKQWKEKAAAEEAKRIQTREEINKLWSDTNKDLSEKVDDYHDSPDDKELLDARQAALAAYDAPPKTMKDRVIKDAHNRQRVAAFSVQKLIIARLQKKLEEQAAEMDGLKEKTPKPPTARAGGTTPEKPAQDWETEAREALKGR